MAPSNAGTSPSLRSDLTLALALIALCVVARLVPHVSNVSSVAACALFAGWTMGRRSLALMVPLVAMLAGDAITGFYDARVMIVVYAALALPALIGMGARGLVSLRGLGVLRGAVPAALASSLVFFAATNFAVWAWGGLYSHDAAGLVQCYVAALPFLKFTVAGDLLWTVALFGGAWLIAKMSSRPSPAVPA